MARIRTVKPAFFRHGGLYDAEKETGLPLRVAFAGLWTACDKEGRFAWKPRELKLDVLPYDEVDFSRVLDALTTRGFIVRYRVGDADYGHVPTWHKHQIINNRETASVLPDPAKKSTGSNKLPPREARVDDASGTRLVHAQGEGEGEGKGKGKGREGEDIAPTPRGAAAPKAPSAETWDAYARAYERRYSATPVRNVKVNGQLANLVSRLGSEAPSVAEFYVGHDDPFYVRQMHSADYLVRDAEKLRTQWATGHRPPAQINGRHRDPIAEEAARDAENARTTAEAKRRIFGTQAPEGLTHA